LLQLDSTFSERSYGASSFRDFAEKLAGAGLVRLKQAGRSLLVELIDSEMPSVAVGPQADGRVVEEPPPPVAEAPQPPVPDASSQAEGVRAAHAMLEAATAPLRWPMYVRNVKQFLRSMDSGFDERRYGFAGILDFLRALQREGLLRLERDRQGVLRVHPGALISRPIEVAAQADPQPALAVADAHAGAESEVPEIAVELPVPQEVFVANEPASGDGGATIAREPAVSPDGSSPGRAPETFVEPPVVAAEDAVHEGGELAGAGAPVKDLEAKDLEAAPAGAPEVAEPAEPSRAAQKRRPRAATRRRTTTTARKTTGARKTAPRIRRKSDKS
jgi:hypothetical protein